MSRNDRPLVSSLAAPSAFEKLARELGCDPDNPGVTGVLRNMAAHVHKPHAAPQSGKAKKGKAPQKS